jgi:thiosulfate sulfurtransferase
MKNFKSISVEDSKRLISKEQPLILDCRDLKDYQAGHLENAMHLHDKLRESLIMSSNKQRPVLIYCYYGHASEHLAQMFADFGFKEVYSLIGGYADWKQHITV